MTATRPEPWQLSFHDLMPHRVREILLVSSPYDAFTLEEDGRLSERIHNAYHELNLTSAPRITHVATGAGAMKLLEERRFDMVLTMVRIIDTDVSAFARRVKQTWPDMPVVLLVLTEADLYAFPGGVDPAAVDYVFWWTGDARIHLAIVKLVEDMLNAPHDTRNPGVRVIIVVEDSVRRYSSFLSMLYAELMSQSKSLIYEGLNQQHRLMRMKARPKLLLARTYEEAVALFERYKEHVLALITDVRLPKNGEENAGAGFELVDLMRAHDPELAVLVQSAERNNADIAAALGVHYADKNSATLLNDLRAFVTESLGFGDFIFRMPDRTEVCRAKDMWELEEALRTAPIESVVFHASRNHFSLWMMARAMFSLAREVRPKTVAELGDEGVRRYLLHAVADARRRLQEGVVTDFSTRSAAAGAPFVRVGTGSIGGKARGLAFVSALISRRGLKDRIPGLSICVPRSVVIGAGEFERFIEKGQLAAEVRDLDEQAMRQRFMSEKLAPDVVRDLRRAVASMSGPLAVRSSSLLEDSQLQPFAGIYATYMLPNNHPDPEVRFRELRRAVKAVYASTWCTDAQAYMEGTPYSLEEERMAVLIQEVVGRTYGDRFYPNAAGVAVSYNYYPVASQKAEDGLAMLALGLGQTVVQGEPAVQFSPAAPEVLPQFGSARDYLRYSQRKFYALDLSRPLIDFLDGAEASLRQHSLTDAAADGTLALAGSTYSRDDDTIRDGPGFPGAPVVTFHNILKYDAVPLAAALRELLAHFRDGMGSPVEIEFALDAGDWGRRPAREPAQQPTLYVLQVRPQARQAYDTHVQTDGFPEDQVFCRTDRALGHGIIDDIRDLVVVKRDDLQASETPAVAEQIGKFNARLVEEKRPYLLIGPGRWGSSDPRLGIPVRWAQIAGAKVIIETDFCDREVEPSQGAHFFHNVTSFRIGYLTFSNLERRETSHKRRFDQEWLRDQPAFAETAEVRHIRLARPVKIHLDGRHGTAVIRKPD